MLRQISALHVKPRVAAVGIILLLATVSVARGQSGVDGVDGLELDSTSTAYDRAVDGAFTVFGVGFVPHDLSIFWEPNLRKFGVYGAGTIFVEGDSIDIDLGSKTDPGLVIQNDAVTQVRIGVSATFHVSGVTIHPDDLTFGWNGDSQQYEMYGDLKLEIDGKQLTANLGDAADPGLAIADGTIAHVNIGITSDIHLAGLTMTTQDLRVEFDTDSGLFGVGGSVTVADLWSATLDMGSPHETGVTIDTGGDGNTFSVEDVTFEIDQIDLGAIDFRRVRIEIKNDALHDVDLDVGFPEGWQVEAELVFDSDPFALNEIRLDWEADNIENAIEIGDTGVLLVKIEGAVANIDEPTDIKVIGVVGLAFGGPFEIEGREVSLIHLQDSVSITRSKLEVDGALDLGAYKNGNMWHSLLGRGNVTVVLKWGREYYLTGNVRVPTHPTMVEADAKMYLDSAGDLDALMDVSFIVPDDVPYVGGDRLGSVDGAFRYRNHHPKASYAAAWTTVNLEFDKFTIGAKYNFGSRKISEINGDDVSDIQDQITNDEQRDGTGASIPVCSIKKKFIAGPGAPPKYYSATLISTVPDLFSKTTPITATGVGQPLPLFLLTDTPSDPGSIHIPDHFDYRKFSLDPSASGDTLHFLIAPTPAVSGSAISPEFTIDQHATLTPGKYQLSMDVLCDAPSSVSSSAFELDLKPIYPAPDVRIDVPPPTRGATKIDLHYWSYFPDSTTVSVYWSATRDYSGTLIGHFDYGPRTHTREQTSEVDFDLPVASALDRVYVYAVIDDLVSTPVYTPFVNADLDAAISGTVTSPAGGLAGATLTLETVGDGHLFYAFETDDSGAYAIHNLPEGEYVLSAFTPSGFQWSDAHTGVTLKTPQWAQVPVHGGTHVRHDFRAVAGTSKRP